MNGVPSILMILSLYLQLLSGDEMDKIFFVDLLHCALLAQSGPVKKLATS
jgi:hypothetical protein